MKKYLLLIAIFVFATLLLTAQKPEIFTKEGKAVEGYDVVAFFTAGNAIKGNDSLSYIWKDAKWLFSTNENRSKFEKNPDGYAPQYGGYCAFGASKNYKAPAEVNTWTIIQDKLYFNYNSRVKESWSKSSDSLISKANLFWPSLKKS